MFALPIDIDGRNGIDLIVSSKGSGAGIGCLESPAHPRDVTAWKYHKLRDAGWIMSLDRFDMDKDGNVAFNEVQARVKRILRDLPNEAEPPVVAKIEIGALPVMWLSLTGDRTIKELNQYARTFINERHETINAVVDIKIGG